MNCENPITIYNNTRTFRYGVDKVVRQVPCGNCPACRKAIQDAWFLRIKEQIEHTKSLGGIVLFPTFTYNQEHCPHFNFDTSTVSFHSTYTALPNEISCFNRYDIQRFMRAFKKALLRDGIINIKYIICAEKGSKSTKRPHYHCLFFINEDLSKISDVRKKRIIHYWLAAYGTRKFNRLSTQEKLDILNSIKPRYTTPHDVWNLIQHLWSDEYNFGHISASKYGFLIKGSNGAARYISKYITKDLNWYGDSQVSSYLNEPCKRALHHDYIKDYLPKHYQSQYFGASFIDKFFMNDYSAQLDMLKNGMTVLDSKGNSKKYPLPLYWMNKICFCETPIYKLRNRTQIKKDFDKLMLDERIDMRVKAYERILNTPQCIITSEDLNSILKANRFMEGDYTTFANQINDMLRGRSLRDLAMYDVCLRDRSILNNAAILKTININDKSTKEALVTKSGVAGKSRVHYSFHNMSKYSYDWESIHNIGREVYNNCIDQTLSDDDYQENDLTSLNKDILYSIQVYNTLPMFYDFDNILDVFQDITSLRSHYVNKKYEDEGRRLKEIKDKINNILYKN